ncbi:MAG: hypothetical protein AMJ54_06060 [Deltaproteobacteria bacterium SG8_13]|nr:MAG: hypothetical protein AMJ54_06060 [Deltaproteobacteria bacterium SG8_13]
MRTDDVNAPTQIQSGFSVVIPVFNHAETVGDVARDALQLGFPVFVVDDGSADDSAERAGQIEGVTLLRHDGNRGKGAAIKTGMRAASRISRWAITLDADGQHNPLDARILIRSIPEESRPIVVGVRQGMDAVGVHWTSRFGRKFSNFWVWAAGGHRSRDSQSGFRIYPLPETLQLGVVADRYQFEVEVIVKARWKKLPLVEAPVSVRYPPGERVSHFRPFVDFMRNSTTFSRLIVQRLFLPPAFRRRMIAPRDDGAAEA